MKNLELHIILDPSNKKVDSEILSVLDLFHDDKRIKLTVNKRKIGIARSLNLEYFLYVFYCLRIVHCYFSVFLKQFFNYFY